jgi:hypothetical protein
LGLLLRSAGVTFNEPVHSRQCRRQHFVTKHFSWQPRAPFLIVVNA